MATLGHHTAIMLVCDFYLLDHRFRNHRNHFNLRQTVQVPTRGNVVLDLIFTNLSLYYNTPKIILGIELSDHNSLIIHTSQPLKNLRLKRCLEERLNQV